MRAQDNSQDPGRILAHASVYLWTQWRQYPLPAWEDAESILRRAHDAVEEEDRIEFVHTLDEFFADRAAFNVPAGLERV